jgi:hypothetical protein
VAISKETSVSPDDVAPRASWNLESISHGRADGCTINELPGVYNLTWKANCHAVIGLTGAADLLSRSGLIFRIIAPVIIVAMLRFVACVLKTFGNAEDDRNG